MNRRHTDPFHPSPLFWRLVFAAALLAVALLNEVRAGEPVAACCDCQTVETCSHCSAAPTQAVATEASSPSWIFRRGRYTHDPATGDRVAQYDRINPVEPLNDPRLVTSGYSRQRTALRGADGTVNTYYKVQSYGNASGGFEAQQERMLDSMRGAYGGGYGGGYGGYGYGGGYDGYPPFYGPNFGGGWGGYGFNAPGFAYPPAHSYGWGAGPAGGPRGGPGYATPYGPVQGDAAEGYDSRAWRTPDREFYPKRPKTIP